MIEILKGCKGMLCGGWDGLDEQLGDWSRITYMGSFTSLLTLPTVFINYIEIEKRELVESFLNFTFRK